MTSTTTTPEIIGHVALHMPIEIHGRDAKKLSQKFCEELQTKREHELRADLLITSQRVIVVPSGKNRGDILAMGALGGPLGIGLGLAADRALEKLAELRNRKVDVRQKFNDDELSHCAVWGRDKMSFRVFEERTSWDLFGGEWATFPEFSGRCDYMGEAYDVALTFPFYGKFKGALKARPKQALPIMECFEYSVDQVTRR